MNNSAYVLKMRLLCDPRQYWRDVYKKDVLPLATFDRNLGDYSWNEMFDLFTHY